MSQSRLWHSCSFVLNLEGNCAVNSKDCLVNQRTFEPNQFQVLLLIAEKVCVASMPIFMIRLYLAYLPHFIIQTCLIFARTVFMRAKKLLLNNIKFRNAIYLLVVVSSI